MCTYHTQSGRSGECEHVGLIAVIELVEHLRAALKRTAKRHITSCLGLDVRLWDGKSPGSVSCYNRHFPPYPSCWL